MTMKGVKNILNFDHVVYGWPQNENALYDNLLRSTEFISFEHPPIKGPNLPFTIERHGMITYDESTIFIIGGYQDGMLSNRTWIIEFSNEFKIKEGPSLNIARYIRKNEIIKYTYSTWIELEPYKSRKSKLANRNFVRNKKLKHF